MDTSGTGTVFAIGYWVVLAMTIMCAVQLLGDLGQRLRAPRPAALAMVAVVAVPSLIELGWHGIYTVLSRQPDQIKDHHEYWRLLTGSIVQDGGLEGTVFNLLGGWPWCGCGRFRRWPRRWWSWRPWWP
jgi:hypothetical protein